MATRHNTWWADRVGEAAAATTSSTSPQPNYGVAWTIGTSTLLTPTQREQAINAMQTVAQTEATRQAYLNNMFGWMMNLSSQVNGPRKRSFFERVRDTAGDLVGGVGDVVGGAVDAVRSLNDQQNRFMGTEDEYEQAREWAGSGLGAGMEAYERYVGEPVERGLSVPLQLGNVLDEVQKSESWADSFEAWLQAETYAEAWRRTEDSTFGQSVADMFVKPEVREAGYEGGFGEDGLPIDATYRELRESDTAYNLTSGTADFLQEWFTDPLTVATAGVGRVRAYVKGDLDRLPRGSAATIRRIVGAPDEALEELRSRRFVNPVAARALQLREQVGQLRDRVRAGELDQTGLIEQVQAFRHDPTAAALFHDLSTARKWDEANLAYVDEFDDDVFYHGVGALLGSPTAIDKLRAAFGDRGRQIAQQIDNLSDTRIPQLDDEVRLAEAAWEEAATNPNLSGFQRYERMFTAEKDLATLRREGGMLNEQLDEYDSHRRFLAAVDDRVAQASTSMVPRASQEAGDIVGGVAAHTYRSGPNGKAHTYVKVKSGFLRNRPGVMDLSRNIWQPADNYLGEAFAIGGQKAVDNLAAATDGGLDIDLWRRDMLNKAASASTDVERRTIAGQVEMAGIELVARKHGLTPGDARQIASMYNRRRGELFADIERQHTENRAYSAAASDDPIRYSYNNNNTEETIELPLTLTQLKNYHVPMDLKALDNILTQHGGGFRGQLARGGEMADWAMNIFNSYWKPLVLFRGGYVVRNVSDEMIRGVAAANTLMVIPDAVKAGTIGLVNLPIRAANRVSRTWNAMERRRYRRRQAQDPLLVREGTEDAYEINTSRLPSVEKNLAGVERWTQRRLGAEVGGKRLPKAPAIITKLNAAMESGETFAYDLASNRVRNVDTVTPLDVGEAVVQDVTGVARFADDHADLLSHADGVLMVTPVKDGFRVNVGRRGARYARLFGTVDQLGSRSGTVKGRSGAKIEHAGAFEQGVGDVFRTVASSAPFHKTMVSSYESELKRLRTEARGFSSTIGDQEHAANWLRIINDQLRPDPAVRARLEGKDLATWVKGEGRDHAARIKWRSAKPDIWQQELDASIDTLLPTEALRAKVATGEPITEVDLQHIIDQRFDVAPKAVDSTAVDMAVGGRLSRSVASARDKVYNWIATIPTDSLVRHPFFNRMYRNRLKAAADQLEAGQTIGKETLQIMERQAREYALRQTRRYMFAGDEMSGLTHTLRHLTVFQGAWAESLQRYARIISERPEQFVRLYTNGWQQLDDNGFVEFVDQNGLGKDDPDHGDLDYIRIPGAGNVLKFMDKLVPGDQSAAAEIFETFSINKNGLNTVLQGDPWWLPGAHPWVQAPATFMLADHPDLADENSFSSFMYKYLLPTGPASLQKTLFPAAWMTETFRYFKGANDPVFNRMTLTRVHQQRYNDWVANGRQGPEPDFQESLDIGKGAQAAWIAARFMSPASFNPEVKGQMFIDMANQVQSEHGFGEGGFKAYLDLAGDDQAIWWTATTQNNSGVPATSAGFRQSERYKDLIAKNPELGLALVGLDAETDEFNYQVYRHQTETPISDLSDQKHREALGPEAVVTATEERQGWAEWKRWNVKIDAELAARGLQSVDQRGAEDLKLIKAGIRGELASTYPGWRDAMSQFDTDRTYGIVRSIRSIIESGDAPDRPDWDGWAEFVDWEARIGAELDARFMAGGSRSIEHNDNADLLFAYNTGVGQIKLANLMFAEAMDRVLPEHNMTLGSGI
ncbi:hypothetical protein [Jiangella gansuensis]|uniref:hypothetical protein n=1 Tax=Jiangella gansuensis TaxID=281473 RepID=UPI00047AAE2C|nr:hypothetical protein [Jiangella gansuensis]